MGNAYDSTHQSNLITKFNQNDWIFVSLEDNYQIWRNKYSNVHAQVYESEDMHYIKDMNRYQIRSYDNELVKVYHILLKSNAELCRTNPSASILMERIPLRLYQINNINREEALTILVSSLRAFSIIEQTCQIVVPNEALIGFNQKGKTKVWLNKYFYHNYVDKLSTQRYLQEGTSQAQRIKIIFEMIQQRSRQIILPPQIKQHIYKPSINYSQLLDIIQDFAYRSKVNIKRYINIQKFILRNNDLYNSGIYQRNRSTSNINKISYLNFNQQKSVIKGQLASYQYQFQNKLAQSQLNRAYSTNSIHMQKVSNTFNNVFSKRSISPSNNKSHIVLSRTQVASNLSNTSKVTYPKIIFSNNHQITLFVRPSATSQYNREPSISKSQDNQASIIKKFIFTQKNKENNPFHHKDQQDFPFKNELLKPIMQEHDKVQQNIQKMAKKQHKQQTLQVIESLAFNSSQQQMKMLCHPQLNINFTAQQSHHQFISFAPTKQYIQIPEDMKQSQHPPQLHQNTIIDTQQQEQRRISHQKNKLPDINIIDEFQLICKNVESNFHFATKRQDQASREEYNIRQSISEVKKIEFMDHDEIQQYIRLKYLVNSIDNVDQNYDGIEKKVKSNKLIVERNLVYQNRNSQQDQFKYTKSKHYQQKYKMNGQYYSNMNKIENQDKNTSKIADFLDVNFLQKSLDQRFKKIKKNVSKKEIEDDNLNISKLQEGLKKFSLSQLKESQMIDHKVAQGNQYSSDSSIMINGKFIQRISLQEREKEKNFFDKNLSNGQQMYQAEKYCQNKVKQTSSSEFIYTLPPKIHNRSKQRQQEDVSQKIWSRNSSKNRSNDINFNHESRDTNFPEKSKGQSSFNQRKISYDELREFLWK